MSGNLVDGVLTIPIRAPWVQLPGEGEDAVGAIAAIVAHAGLAVDSIAARRLTWSLGKVVEVAGAMPAGRRTSYALIEDPAAGRVDALLTYRVSRVTEDAAANYLEAARSFTGTPEVEVIHRTVEPIELPAGDAILSHDFTLPVQRGGVLDPALDRFFLTLFPSGGETGIEFTLLTPNLALFDNDGDYLVSLVRGEDPALPGRVDA